MKVYIVYYTKLVVYMIEYNAMYGHLRIDLKAN